MRNYKLTKNLGLKIMALIFAIFLWLIVVNIDDPVESSTFRGISVTIQNEEIVTNQGKIIQILDDTQTVSVSVKAKRSVLAKITSSKITATADMSDMELNSLVPITVSIQGYEGSYTAEAIPHNLHVKTDDKTKHTFPITVSASGTPRDGFVVGTMTTNPAEVTIRGPQSLINTIDKAVAKVDVSGLSVSSDLDAQLTLYDVNGNPIDQSQLTINLGDQGITVSVQMLDTKDVPLKFDVSGTPADGYIYTGLVSEPESVEVCGTTDALEGFDELDIPASAIDVTEATEKFQTTVSIQEYLPDGISLVDENSNMVVVNVSIDQAGVRTIELATESVKVNNLADNLKVTFVSDTDIELQFSGPKDVLDKLDIKDAVSVDLKSYTKPGVFDVPLDIGVISGVQSLSQQTVKVTLTEKEKTEKTTD